MPEPCANGRRSWIDNSTDPISVRYVDCPAYIVRIQPLDESVAEDAGSPVLRHCPIRLLLVDQLDVAQMARRIARPPDAVRVGGIEFDPSCIGLRERQRELRRGFRRAGTCAPALQLHVMAVHVMAVDIV